ncbi:MAG: TonB-dependent receptor [Acidobacteriota bacterium]|nr:MAG: TonB-dependent receptor [Acidobacteriota bacterium]
MRRVIFATLTIGIFAVLAVAQTTTGRLSGNVSGPDGLLPGATVTITDNQTGRELTTTSNESGAYLFERIPFGVYTLRVSSDGFKTYVANNVRVDANTEYTLNPTLELGDVSVEVTVEAGAELVNASNAELSTTVDKKQILDLPIDGRNPLSLLSLQAGVNATAGNHVNGQRTSSTNFTRDGINVQDNFIRTGGFVQDRPSVDDTGEFTVVTQNAGADLGGGGTAQIQLVTPRGGSEFHGGAYIYNRNSKFAANDFGNNATGVGRPFLNRNQFGGKIGGPFPLPGFGQGTPFFYKDKAFFFVNYERFLLVQQTPKTATTLLPQFHDGTFTYTDNGGVTQTVNVLTGAGMTGPIPAASGGVLGVSPIIQSRVLSRLPSSGNGNITNGGLTQQYFFNQQNNDTRDAVTTRFDVDINDSNSVYFVYKYNKNADDRTDIDNTFNTVPVNTQGGPTQGYLLSWTTILGSNFTNELRGAYNQSDPFFFEDPNFPTDFVIGGIPFTTNPQSTFQAQGRKTDQYTLQNNSSFVTGNHTMRFGIDLNAQRIDSQTNFNRVGIYNITTTSNPATPALPTSLFPGGISSTQRARADALRYLLGGVVGSGTIAAPFQGPELGPVLGSSQRQRFEYNQWALYFADQWKVTPELTLNLGMRWDYFSPLKNPDVVYLEPDLEGADDLDTIRQNLLDPTGQYVLIGNNAGTPGQFHKADLNNFGPVVSFAYSPIDRGGILGALFGDSGVLRGGFRLGYINDEYVRGPDNAAGGNVGLDLTGRALNNGSVNLNCFIGSCPGFTLPPFTPPPISFATGNANAGNFFNTVFAVDPNLEMQRNMQYNFGFSREIGFDTAIEFRYVGGRSDNMVRGVDYNQVLINENGFLTDFLNARENCRQVNAGLGLFLNERQCTATEMTTGLPVSPQLAGFLPLAGFIRDYVQQGIIGELALIYIINGFEGFNGATFRRNQNAGVVDLLSNFGKYRYDAFQFEVRKRLTDGLQFQANYTYGKVLTDIQSDGQARFDPLIDNDQPEIEYARADYDRTHTINFNAIYDLPFGQGRPFLNQGGVVDKIFGGWQITSIINISSGTPISIKDINGTLNRTGRSNRQTANSSLSVDQIRNLLGIRFVNGTIYYIDPSVIGPDGSATNGNVEGTITDFPGQVFFRAQPGTTGRLARNLISGPWYYNWDAGIIKNIRFGENINLQFRAEAFNVLNKTNFFIGENSGIFDVDSTTFGQVSAGSNYGPRIMQFAFRLDF